MTPDRSGDRGDPASERVRASAARAARAVEPPVPPRRQPQQARSQAKVDALLDAADSIVVDAGVEGLTTTLVAARAGVAVGSLYRYFDGVPALLDALAARHTAELGRALELALVGRRFRRKRDAANAALDVLIDHARAHPAFRAVWQGAPSLVAAHLTASADLILAVVVDAIVSGGLAVPSDPTLELETQIQWATASALILLAFRRDPDGDPVVLAHLRHLFTLDIVTTDDVDLNRLDEQAARPIPARD